MSPRCCLPVCLRLVLTFILSASILPGAVSADTIVRGDSDDTIPISLGDHTVDGGGGNDSILLPLFPNEYTFTQVPGRTCATV